MSLATRCTSCGIVFRVVQDQLKVSEGWVRCGRCDAVFNALQGLFDLERDEPPEWAPAASAAPVADPEAAAERHVPVEPETEPTPTAHIDERLFRPRAADGSGAANRVRQDERNEFEDARFNTELMLDDAEPSLAGPETEGFAAVDVVQPDLAGTEAPQFLQQAERKARWQSRTARRALWAGALVLLLTLSFQAVHQFREVIAARWPATAGLVAAWCASVHCSVEPPRRIHDLSVESTGLTQAVAGSTSYRLAISLRNRAAMVVALPWIELSISDANGQLVSRRVLGPADFAASTTRLQPGSEMVLSASLTTAEQKVSGYTIELFYP